MVDREGLRSRTVLDFVTSAVAVVVADDDKPSAVIVFVSLCTKVRERSVSDMVRVLDLSTRVILFVTVASNVCVPFDLENVRLVWEIVTPSLLCVVVGLSDVVFV